MQEYVENRKCSQRHAVKLTRQRFLDLLQAKWISDNLLVTPVTVEDLLDDAATIGCPGASDAYFGYLFKTVNTVAKKGPKHGSVRGTYARK